MSSDDKYARSIARVVAAQLMAAQGIDSAQRSTVEILSDLLVRYIVEIGAQSHMYSELSHRTECTPTDVAMALKNMGQSIPELLKYSKEVEDSEASLVQNVSQFPVAKSLPPLVSFASNGEAPPSHIPDFLPAFPDPHTLMETAKFTKTAHTTHTRQQQITEQQKRGEEALLRVEAREHPENAPLQSAKERLDRADEAGEPEKEEIDNAFLAPVLWEASAAQAPAALPPPPAPLETQARRISEKLPEEQTEDGGAMEWVLPEKSETAAPDINFEGFQLTGAGSRVALATSGRMHVPDAYGDDGYDVDLSMGGGARRRRLVTTTDTNRNRAKEILSTRAEDADVAYGIEETPMDLEMI